jgi:hypothetical protein
MGAAVCGVCVVCDVVLQAVLGLTSGPEASCLGSSWVIILRCVSAVDALKVWQGAVESGCERLRAVVACFCGTLSTLLSPRDLLLCPHLVAVHDPKCVCVSHHVCDAYLSICSAACVDPPSQHDLTRPAAVPAASVNKDPPPSSNPFSRMLQSMFGNASSSSSREPPQGPGSAPPGVSSMGGTSQFTASGAGAGSDGGSIAGANISLGGGIAGKVAGCFAREVVSRACGCTGAHCMAWAC